MRPWATPQSALSRGQETEGQGLVVPKTGIPLVDIDALRSDPVDELLVFSFGYMQEIQAEAGALGYATSQFHSMLNVLAGRF